MTWKYEYKIWHNSGNSQNMNKTLELELYNKQEVGHFGLNLEFWLVLTQFWPFLAFERFWSIGLKSGKSVKNEGSKVIKIQIFCECYLNNGQILRWPKSLKEV